MCSTGEDVLCESGTSSVQASRPLSFGTGGTSQKYSLMNKSSLLLIYQVKMVSSLWQAAKMSINYKISKVIFSF